MRPRLILGFVLAAVFAVLAIVLRRQVVELAPARMLDTFLVGIGITAYFFSWIPAAALLGASLIIAISYPPSDSGAAISLVRLLLYSCVSVAAIAAIHRLKTAVQFWRGTEESYRTLFEEASDGIATADKHLHLLAVNSRFCEMLGYSRDELLRMSVKELVFTENAEHTPLELFTHTGAGVHELRLRRKDGSSIIAEISTRVLRDGRLIAIGRDVTGRKQAEQALSESEAMTRSMLYSAVDGIVTIDEHGFIHSFNPAAEALFGWTADEVLGKNVNVLMPPPYDAEHDGYIRNYLGTGVKRVVGIGREVAAKRKDGTTFPIELSVSELLLPGRRMFTGIIRDITGRRQADERLRQANEALGAVIQTSPLAIFTMDLEGNVGTWNAAAERIFGWTEAEVVGRPLPIVPEAEWPVLLESIERVKRSDDLRGHERRRLRKDGTLIDVSIWSSALRNREGQVCALINVLADVTERKRLEGQLQEAQKMEAVGRLAGGVAHDFNNALTIITGYARMLHDRLSPAGSAAEVEEILRSAEHAAALTNQLLVFSRRHVIHPQLLDLNLVVAKLDRMLRRIIGEDVELVIVAAPGLSQVRADPGQIEQVIINLAVNARDAMPNGGQLTIETANVELDEAYECAHPGLRPGDYAMLAVSDTGQGIDPQIQARLFEPFFTTKDQGTGLGLTTVYSIVKQGGGGVCVYSEVSKGTTFKVYLPRARAAREEPAERTDVQVATSGAETVLLVEDEAGVRRLVREILKSQGYSVLEAHDARDALRLSEQHPEAIHLLLTDVVMPSMSGRDLADRVAALRPGLKVLYMSGYTGSVMVNHGVLAFGTAFLQKPFTPSQLSRKVREVLDGRL